MTTARETIEALMVEAQSLMTASLDRAKSGGNPAVGEMIRVENDAHWAALQVLADRIDELAALPALNGVDHSHERGSR